MLALEPVIVERLRAALPSDVSWTVKGHTSDTGDRRVTDGALAVVMFAAGDVGSQRNTAVFLRPGYTVTLVTRKGANAAAVLDAGLAAAVADLHNWMPGAVAGRAWEPLVLQRFGPPDYIDDGLAGLELLFVSSGLFDGQS